MRQRLMMLTALVAGCREPSADAADTPALCGPVTETVAPVYSETDAPLPPHFLRSTLGSVAFSDQTPPGNRPTNAGVTLGRVLFYDVRLSRNDRVACASCHRQGLGFGDTLLRSPGLDGHTLPRKTLALANARFNARGRYFWDERAPSLEALALVPVADTLEMGLSPEALEGKLRAVDYYPALFTAAFGTPDISRDRIATALAQFVRALVSAESMFDRMFATGGAPDSTRLPAPVRDGARLFDALGCDNCHRTIAHFADQAGNNGLDVVPADSGAGRGRFKPASLRNVAVRPPYMHDGRFATLREVVEFYDHGVRDSPDLDPRLRAADGSPRRLGLAESQVAALVAFLESLTDSAFLRAERFGDPFPCRGLGRSPSAGELP